MQCSHRRAPVEAASALRWWPELREVALARAPWVLTRLMLMGTVGVRPPVALVGPAWVVPVALVGPTSVLPTLALAAPAWVLPPVAPTSVLRALMLMGPALV